MQPVLATSHRAPASPGIFARVLPRARAGASRGAAVLLFGWMLAEPAIPAPPPGIPARFAREIGAHRMIGPRLSITYGYAACTERVPEGGSIPRTVCPAPPASLRRSDAVRRVAARAAADPLDPGNLHAMALVDLLWADSAGNAIDRSIQSLETAARLSHAPAAILADLSAAYLVRAELRQTPRDLLMAVEAAEEAVEVDGRSSAAAFNLWLALDRVGLPHGAERVRQRLAAHDDSGWAAEDGERAVSALSPADTVAAGASEAEIRRFVERSPQAARLFGWEVVLDRWGAALEAGSAAEAEAQLALAARIGAALADGGGDGSLQAAVAAIRAADPADPAPLRRLASAHRSYAAGRRAYVGNDRPAAARLFAEAERNATGSEALRTWAAVSGAAARVDVGPSDALAAHLGELVRSADAAGWPLAAATARTARGTLFLRAGSPHRAAAEYRPSESVFRAHGELLHAGAAASLQADAMFTAGLDDQAHPAMHRALSALGGDSGSVWRHNVLLVWAEEAEADGLPRAAMRLLDEEVAASAAAAPVLRVETLITRATLASAMGDSARVRADLARASALFPELEGDHARQWFTAWLRSTRGRAALRHDPAAALADLDSAIARFAEDNVVRLLPALVWRAEARLARGDEAGAVRDLERVSAMVAAQRDQAANVLSRSALLASWRSVFDRLVRMHLDRGDAAEALRFAERGRGSPLRTEGATAEEDGAWRMPAGRVAVAYRVMGDTVFAWAVSDQSVAVAPVPVDPDELARTIDRTTARMELGADGESQRPDLAALYDVLIRPVRQALGGAGTEVVIVPDESLAGVPFAALWNADDDVYLVERHTIHVAASVHGAGRRVHRAPPRRPLLVADPAFDRSAHPGLGRLSSAQREVQGIASRYPGAVVIAGGGAGREALVSRLARADALHFAGHAVSDPRRPESSYLLLAPGRDGASGRITAAELEGMELGHLRLVVLSACETVESRGDGAAGLPGLADVLLHAGVGGVVGSLWRVDDANTAALMREFHAAYARSGDAAGALRLAQLTLLRGEHAAQRSPAAWAGFVSGTS